MKTLIFTVILFLAGCGGPPSDAKALCAKNGGQWAQIQTYDAQGHTFNGYHCVGG